RASAGKPHRHLREGCPPKREGGPVELRSPRGVDSPKTRRHMARLPRHARPSPGWSARGKPRGEVAEWLKAADCKSARASVRWFESSPLHHPASLFELCRISVAV